MKKQLAILLICGLALPAVRAQDDSALATGIRQLAEGDIDQAVITLDGAVRDLLRQKGHEAQLASAYLYLATAHLGLGQQDKAKADVRLALKANRGLVIDPGEFPPPMVNLFHEVKAELGNLGLEVPTEVLEDSKAPQRQSPPAGKKGGKKALPILLAAGGAGAVGLALAGGGSAASVPPTTTAPVPTPTPAPTPTPQPTPTPDPVATQALTFRLTPAAPNAQTRITMGSGSVRLHAVATTRANVLPLTTIFLQQEGGAIIASVSGRLSNGPLDARATVSAARYVVGIRAEFDIPQVVELQGAVDITYPRPSQ
jgi:hypothetical protein